MSTVCDVAADADSSQETDALMCDLQNRINHESSRGRYEKRSQTRIKKFLKRVYQFVFYRHIDKFRG